MNQTNLAIYDEFNCIEKICRDMFHAEKGVTTYIETMKMTSSFDAMCVPYWDDTLQMLNLKCHLEKLQEWHAWQWR